MSGGDKKYGRNSVFCRVYELQDRRIKNKKKKLRRHLKKYPEDAQAEKALNPTK